MWVLSASGPVSFCQLAGSPASHGRLYVARAVHCQVRQVSSAQLLSVGCSCRNCPATAGVDTAQLSSSAGVRRPFSYSQSLQLLSSSHLSCSLQLGLSRLTFCRFTGLLARLPRSVSPSLQTSRQTSSPPLAPAIGKGPDFARLGLPAPWPRGPFHILVTFARADPTAHPRSTIAALKAASTARSSSLLSAVF